MNDLGTIIGAIGGAVAGAIATAMAVRRRWSRDTAAVANDDAQVNMLAILQRERDDARAVADDAIAEQLELASRNAILGGEVERLTREARRVRRLVPVEKHQFLGTDVAPLAPLPPLPYGRRRGDSAEQLARELARLPQPQRQVLELWRAGRTCEQIGAELGVTAEQARDRVDEASAALRSQLAARTR